MGHRPGRPGGTGAIWRGSRDRSVAVAHAHVIAARCPAARLHIVDGGGDMLLSHLEHIIDGITPRRQ
jgi:hypothetical protein